MNLNDGKRIEHYTEAERLLALADRKIRELDELSPGKSYERADKEQEISTLASLASTHALLAGLVLPERS